MNRFSLLHWIAFVMIIIALLWITIHYYSVRTVSAGSFALLFFGAVLCVFAEQHTKKK